MPIFDKPVTPRLLWPIHAPWPRRRARNLLRRFQACFPDLTYDIDLGVDLANGQAFLDAGLKRVRLYGGLVRHRRIGSAGLAVALAHETGHHLGGPPFMEFYRWLSSEERAIEWALTIGLQRVYGAGPAQRIVNTGVRQLKALRRVV